MSSRKDVITLSDRMNHLALMACKLSCRLTNEETESACERLNDALDAFEDALRAEQVAYVKRTDDTSVLETW